MIYSGVLAKIITSEYDNKIRRDCTNKNLQYSYPVPKAMLIRFSIELSKRNNEYKEKYLEIMILGQGYVTTLYRITDNRQNYKFMSSFPLDENDKKMLLNETGWIKDGCHDSCWRDSIESILRENIGFPDAKYNTSFVDCLNHWYAVLDLDYDLYKHFSDIKFIWEQEKEAVKFKVGDKVTSTAKCLGDSRR